jgi:hypothetical protein
MELVSVVGVVEEGVGAKYYDDAHEEPLSIAHVDDLYIL